MRSYASRLLQQDVQARSGNQARDDGRVVLRLRSHSGLYRHVRIVDRRYLVQICELTGCWGLRFGTCLDLPDSTLVAGRTLCLS